MVRLQQLAGARWTHPIRRSSLRADPRPRLSYMIDVDQLLRAPGTDAGGVYDHAAARALGIPVISGVPPIVIITPAQREKHPLDGVARRRSR